jgi:hypothetical protein
MDGIMLFFFLLSACFFIGMIHSFLATRRSGVYPPKYILKQRVNIFAASGTVFLLLALLFYLFR